MNSGSDGSTPMMEGGRLLADRYRLLEKVGEGGAAEVFRARDQRLDRTVAIKLLRPQYTHDESSRRRFVIEAKTAAALSHPNVVDIYDFGEAPDGAMFIAMQFIQGQNLKDTLQKRGRLTPAETISIARQACYALAAAHANGLIHRDVKPQNILIDRSGHVHLTDFGIVKALSGPALTQSGMTFGTAAYMSPEQATGAPINAQSDLYSLGCVMYEMLAGTPPFTGDNPAVVAYKQVWDQPRPLHELVPEVPPSLESVVMRLLNKDPGRRYASAMDLVADLDMLNVSSSQPTEAMPLAGPGAPGMPSPSAPRPAIRNPQPAEVGQPVQMPASPAEGPTPVPPARLNTPGPVPHTAPYAPPTRVAPAGQPANPPAYTAAPYAAQGARGVQVNVAPRRGGLGWVAPLIAILLGVGLCALGLWQGRNILGMFGGNLTPTPAATSTAQVVVVPPFVTPSATPKVAAVTASPVAPSPQPPTSTPLPPTDTPAPPPPTDTPAPPPPTDTPVPQPPTDTPAPPTEAPTEAPTPEAAPTDTPEGPTDQPTAEPTVAVNLPNRVDIEDSAFKGGFTRTDGTYHKTTAHWVYGRGTAYWTMSAPFTVDNPPQGEAFLTIAGLDSEDTAKTPISILINGQQIYNGPNPLPNDFTVGPDAPGNWGSYTWTIPAGMLHPGVNVLTINNLSPSARIYSPPFFMLDYATVSWP